MAEETITKSFKYCGITNNLDESEDSLLSDNMTGAINAADQEDRAFAPLFESDSDLEFDGFSESDIDM